MRPIVLLGAAFLVASCTVSTDGSNQTVGFDFFSLLWLFFIFSSLAPLFQKRLLNIARQSLLRRLQENRGSRVIALIHRQETLSFLGFPLFRYIDIDDSEAILRAIRLTDDTTPIDRLPVSTEMPREIYDLMALYPQAAQRRPSVEYVQEPTVPTPRPPARSRQRNPRDG